MSEGRRCGPTTPRAFSQRANVHLGIDIGTSSVKGVVLDDSGRVVAEASTPLDASRPHPLWSEQDPADWWRATDTTVRLLGEAIDGGLSGLRGVGVTGQMHGATLLDASDHVLRPAILWNDGRSSAECAELESLAQIGRAHV